MGAVSAAFDVVFGVFVALILGLAVIAVRWALRRDRAERARRRAGGREPVLGVTSPRARVAATREGDGADPRTGPAAPAPTASSRDRPSS